MSIRETFYNSIELAVVNEHDEGTVMQISTGLGPVHHAACRTVV